MYETDWTPCPGPMLMFEFLQKKGRVSHRKLWLFQAAACRHIWWRLFNDGSR
jgi:hypothetical protein